MGVFPAEAGIQFRVRDLDRNLRLPPVCTGMTQNAVVVHRKNQRLNR